MLGGNGTGSFHNIGGNFAVEGGNSPTWFSYDNADENFDGSITYTYPRVKAQGMMLRLGHTGNGFNTTPTGICVALNKVYVSYDLGPKSEESNEDLVFLSENGHLSAVYNIIMVLTERVARWHIALDKVTNSTFGCRRDNSFNTPNRTWFLPRLPEPIKTTSGTKGH